MSFDLDKAIDDFCKKVEVTESLDQSIRDELASHLREKVEYYLNKRQLTEEEAFRLASQSLGETAEIAARFRSVHGTERAVSQAGRLLYVFVLVLNVHLVAILLRGLIIGRFGGILNSVSLSHPGVNLSIVVCTWMIGMVYIACGLIAAYIAYARDRSDRGQLSHLIRNHLSLPVMLAITLILLVAGNVGIGLRFLSYTVLPFHFSFSMDFLSVRFWIVAVTLIFPFFLMAFMACVSCYMVRLDQIRSKQALFASLLPFGALILIPLISLIVLSAWNITLALFGLPSLFVIKIPWRFYTGTFLVDWIPTLILSALACRLGMWVFMRWHPTAGKPKAHA